MSEPMHRGVHNNLKVGDASHTGAGANAATEEEDELLLLALLERLHSDYAAGRHPDFAQYCAANPRLEDAFLARALAMLQLELAEESEPSSMAHSQGQEWALSPGVLRALAGIPDFAEGTDHADHAGDAKLPERLIAEKPTKYSLETRAADTSKGDS